MKALFSLLLITFFVVSCDKKIANNKETAIKTDTILQKNGTVLSYNTFEGTLMKPKEIEPYLARII